MMKPMNRKSALTLLALVEAAILLPLCLLLGMGKMSNLTFALTLFTILFLSLAAGVFILYKYPETDGEKEDFDPDSIRVSHTREGTIFEAITGLLLAAAWAIALATGLFIGEDGGIIYKAILGMFLSTIIIVFFLIDVYTPSELHFAGKLTNARQVGLAVRMNRILAVLGSLIVILSVIPALHVNWLALCLLGLMVGTIIVFRILIDKAR